MSLNFLLGESLGGGGTVSLRLDAQGKTLSHALLTMPITVPAALVAAAERGDAAHRAALGIRAKGATTKKAARKKASRKKVRAKR
jgi:nucleoid-associated protein YgaU